MDAFRADFIEYLRDNNLLSKVDLEKTDEDINASDYNKELKGFLDEYKIDENELVESKIDINEILSMDFDDLGNLDFDKLDKSDKNKDLFGGFFNFLINRDGIKDQIDTDADGKISKEELSAFASAVAGKDGNADDMSLSDMFNSYKEIEKKEFKVESASSSTPALSTAGATGGTVPAATSSSASDDAAASDTDENTEVRPSVAPQYTVEGLMSNNPGQLYRMKVAQEKNLKTAQDNMESALNGESAIPTNQEVQDAHNAYLEQVDTVSNAENNFRQRIVDQNKKVEDSQTALHESELTVVQNEKLCIALDVKVKAAENSVTSLEKSRDAIQAPGDDASPEQKAAYQTQLSQAQAKVTQAQKELETLRAQYEEQVDVYNASIEERNKAQESYKSECDTLGKLQEEIAAASAANKETLQRLANDWNTKRSNNEESRQANARSYSEQAAQHQANIAVIDIAVLKQQLQ